MFVCDCSCGAIGEGATKILAGLLVGWSACRLAVKLLDVLAGWPAGVV